MMNEAQLNSLNQVLEIQSSGVENGIKMNCHVNDKNNEVSANPFFAYFLLSVLY